MRAYPPFTHIDPSLCWLSWQSGVPELERTAGLIGERRKICDFYHFPFLSCPFRSPHPPFDQPSIRIFFSSMPTHNLLDICNHFQPSTPHLLRWPIETCVNLHPPFPLPYYMHRRTPSREPTFLFPHVEAGDHPCPAREPGATDKSLNSQCLP
ncbi:uncharacterized protein BKA78DRAFT_40146 [Phyllosticta capitalensis]|uniref:uncharacterized protein n=1 Tax=Phyllosticta capitalensis TaxID=121624 RepID=UPI00312EE100